MVRFKEHQNLHGYPYGFIWAEEEAFAEYISILGWVVDRFGPMDPPGSRFETDFARRWYGSKKTGFAFTDPDAAMEFKLRWY
jgi:hypothetical protein